MRGTELSTSYFVCVGYLSVVCVFANPVPAPLLPCVNTFTLIAQYWLVSEKEIEHDLIIYTSASLHSNKIKTQNYK